MIIKAYVLTTLICFLSLTGFSQDFYSLNEGMDWTTNSAWSNTSGGAPCTCAPPFNVGSGDNVKVETNVILTGNIRLKNGSSLLITPADTLWITGNAQFDNGSSLSIENTGALIILGDLDNNNNSDSIIINGYLSVGGDFSNGVGADITGSGEIEVDGIVNNSGTVGGSTSDTLSDGSLGDSSYSAPLPIELLYFYGKAASNGNIIEWASSSESNSDYFTLEKMYGDSYDTIATIQGAGTSNSRIDYSYVDMEPETGYNFYRLSQTDYDGTSEVFYIISVRYMGGLIPGMKVYPNPAPRSEVVKIEVTGYKSEEVLVVVQDVLGRTFYSEILIIGEMNHAIIVVDPYERLSTGTYIITGSNNQKLYSKKLIIQ